eukprot:8683983-Prorocentrum_lima.AAC.1
MARAAGVDVSKADCLVDLRSRIPQFLAPLVDVAVDQHVHEHNLVPALDHENDLGHVLEVLDVVHVILPGLP